MTKTLVEKSFIYRRSGRRISEMKIIDQYFSKETMKHFRRSIGMKRIYSNKKLVNWILSSEKYYFHGLKGKSGTVLEEK